MSVSERETTDMITLREATYSPSKYYNFSITIIELLSEIIGVDPTETNLHLEENCCPEELDRGMRADYNAGRETIGIFKYGGYTVECHSSGKVLILADEDLHEKGMVPLPDSMHSEIQ